MADVLARGYHQARDAGLIETGAVVRLAITMTGFTLDPEVEHVDDSDLTSFEYDGAGYSQHVCASVTWAWSATDDEMQLDCDDDADAFGTTVAAATDPPNGVLVILQVGGSPSDSADWVLGWQDSGSYNNGAGLAYGLTVPAGGFMFSEQA